MRGSEPRIDIAWGEEGDYEALGACHYRAGRPAMVAGVVRAVEAASGEVIGALVVSMPTRNGAWREIAWPRRFSGRAGLARLNDEVRTIARVAVRERFRGMGVARSMVAWYLEGALTPATESVASMGAFCPFFSRAGMSWMVLGPAKGEARLIDALRERGLCPADLLEPGCRARAARDPFLVRELCAWASWRGALRSKIERGPEHLALLAARSVVEARFAFVHDWRDARLRGRGPLATPREQARPMTLFMTGAQRQEIARRLDRLAVPGEGRAQTLVRVLGGGA